MLPHGVSSGDYQGAPAVSPADGILAMEVTMKNLHQINVACSVNSRLDRVLVRVKKLEKRYFFVEPGVMEMMEDETHC